MATHGMAEDALPSPVDRDFQLVRSNGLWQLLRDVRKHVVVRRIHGVGRVEVEAGASTKVPVLVFALDARATGGRVREEEGDTLFRGWAEKTALLSTGG